MTDDLKQVEFFYYDRQRNWIQPVAFIERTHFGEILDRISALQQGKAVNSRMTIRYKVMRDQPRFQELHNVDLNHLIVKDPDPGA